MRNFDTLFVVAPLFIFLTASSYADEHEFRKGALPSDESIQP